MSQVLIANEYGEFIDKSLFSDFMVLPGADIEQIVMNGLSLLELHNNLKMPVTVFLLTGIGDILLKSFKDGKGILKVTSNSLPLIESKLEWAATVIGNKGGILNVIVPPPIALYSYHRTQGWDNSNGFLNEFGSQQEESLLNVLDGYKKLCRKLNNRQDMPTLDLAEPVLGSNKGKLYVDSTMLNGDGILPTFSLSGIWNEKFKFVVGQIEYNRQKKPSSLSSSTASTFTKLPKSLLLTDDIQQRHNSSTNAGAGDFTDYSHRFKQEYSFDANNVTSSNHQELLFRDSSPKRGFAEADEFYRDRFDYQRYTNSVLHDNPNDRLICSQSDGRYHTDFTDSFEQTYGNRTITNRMETSLLSNDFPLAGEHVSYMSEPFYNDVQHEFDVSRQSIRNDSHQFSTYDIPTRPPARVKSILKKRKHSQRLQPTSTTSAYDFEVRSDALHGEAGSSLHKRYVHPHQLNPSMNTKPSAKLRLGCVHKTNKVKNRRIRNKLRKSVRKLEKDGNTHSHTEQRFQPHSTNASKKPINLNRRNEQPTLVVSDLAKSSKTTLLAIPASSLETSAEANVIASAAVESTACKNANQSAASDEAKQSVTLATSGEVDEAILTIPSKADQPVVIDLTTSIDSNHDEKKFEMSVHSEKNGLPTSQLLSKKPWKVSHSGLEDESTDNMILFTRRDRRAHYRLRGVVGPYRSDKKSGFDRKHKEVVICEKNADPWVPFLAMKVTKSNPISHLEEEIAAFNHSLLNLMYYRKTLVRKLKSVKLLSQPVAIRKPPLASHIEIKERMKKSVKGEAETTNASSTPIEQIPACNEGSSVFARDTNVRDDVIEVVDVEDCVQSKDASYGSKQDYTFAMDDFVVLDDIDEGHSSEFHVTN